MSTKPFDRTQFKGASLAANKSAQEAANRSASTGFSDGRAGFNDIVEGKNVFRIAPPHNPDNPALEPICKTFLPRKVKDRDDPSKTIIKNMPVFNSRTHSPIHKDIVDEYINFAMKLFYKEYSKDEAKKKLSAITGYREKTGKWVSGIRPTLEFRAYTWKNGTLGRTDFNKTIVDRMNDLSITEESNEAIAVDPFSDPDLGVNLIVDYDKSGEAGKKYKVNKGSVIPLTDAQLMELSDAEPLSDMLRNAYTRNDFNNAVEGLKIFDEKNGYHLFVMQEFISIVEEVRDLVYNCPDIKESNRPEDSKKDSPVRSAPVSNAKPISSEHESHNPLLIVGDSDDGLDELTIDELKDYIDYNNLNVVVKPAFPKSKIVKDIRAAMSVDNSAPDDLPFDNDGNDKETKSYSNEGADGSSIPDSVSKAKSRLAAMKDKVSKKSK